MIILVHLRLAIPHAALAVAYGVDRATVTRAVGQIRPVLARRGHATTARARLRTLADVFGYTAAEGVTPCLDATEIRVRRPGRMHDLIAVRIEGIDTLLDAYPDVTILVDAGYQGPTRDHHGQVSAPPLKPRPGTPSRTASRLKQQRKHQSSQRIPVEHAITEPKWWRVLPRFAGRRELLPETISAVAGLVSGKPPAHLVNARSHWCMVVALCARMRCRAPLWASVQTRSLT